MMMFRADEKRSIANHYPKADLINVRANRNNLQFCIFEINKDSGGYKILNEGHIPINKVMSFILPTKRRIKEGMKKQTLEDIIKQHCILTPKKLKWVLSDNQKVLELSNAIRKWIKDNDKSFKYSVRAERDSYKEKE